jgi:thioredoxin-like negative regulator of GroEL
VIELLLEAERALSFGRVDHAEQLYRQVAAADPGNSIAVVGLARVALEHADDAGAYLLARQALTIDPENEAAQRLVTRLGEVMRTRGETVPEPAAFEPIATEPAEPAPTASPGPQPEAPPAVIRRRSIIDRLRRR